MFRAISALVVSVGLFAALAWAESRSWTDSTGQFNIEAEFQEYSGGSVTLLKADGETVTVPMTKLSRTDQTWVRARLREMRSNKNRPTRGNMKSDDRESGQRDARPATNRGAPGDWLQWRGPDSNNIAPGPAAPTQWNDTQNVKWKVEVPGRGHSSPIIVGDYVILTSADENRQTTGVFAYDKMTGKPVWKTPITQGGFQGELHAKNTHATSTVASNGKQLFVVFIQNQTVQLVALDIQGKLQWQVNAGPYVPQQYKFGYGPSPMLYDDMVIVASEFEKGWLAAFSQSNGQSRWKQPRSGISFSSPVVAKIGGKDQMLISGLKAVSSYDPKTGEPLWAVPGTTNATCGTMVWEGDTVFASGGFPDPQTIAVKAGGSGQVLWTNNEKCYEQSMLAHDGYLYAFNDGGIFFCWDGQTGEEKWKTRLGGPVSASPLLSGENIFVANEKGNVWVIKANPQSYDLVAENRLGDEVFATPIVSQGRLYARYADSSQGRRQEYLICLEQQ
ncbi:outer membrane protein assembly factor BamB family protein [Bremerella alba]|uniref:Outer membrane protein assembly factor BamB n=1 Tax=Bremerella alba TaxID=980252 RepID=A0A7V8V1Y1_9BACT|nr:PQQ-binding-like beta-propeller repeat protein [Bremerella alba]MBA2113442.1 Outer membrane protein assembly factor BamB [Bremerella alba]